MAPAKLDRSARERRCARRELVKLHLELLIAELAERGDLVADELPALGMGGVGLHV
jgi:hypothetical protein